MFFCAIGHLLFKQLNPISFPRTNVVNTNFFDVKKPLFPAFETRTYNQINRISKYGEQNVETKV